MPRWRTASTMRARRWVKSGKELLERLEPRDRRVVGEVEVQRGDGDAAALHGLEVGAGVVAPRRRPAADPVIRPPTRIQSLDDPLGVDALAERRDLHAAKLPDGEVDVEDDLRVALLREEMPHEARGELRAAVEGEVLSDERGEGDGGDVEQRSFERGGDRAGVGDVVAEVRAEVDAGDDEVGAVLLHQLQDRQVHAVRRRAVDDPLVLFELQEAQRTVERERVRGRALLAVGRDDDDVAGRLQRRGELAQAFAVDAVVVGEEDAGHYLTLLASRMKFATSDFSFACAFRSMYIMCPPSK